MFVGSFRSRLVSVSLGDEYSVRIYTLWWRVVIRGDQRCGRTEDLLKGNLCSQVVVRLIRLVLSTRI